MAIQQMHPVENDVSKLETLAAESEWAGILVDLLDAIAANVNAAHTFAEQLIERATWREVPGEGSELRSRLESIVFHVAVLRDELPEIAAARAEALKIHADWREKRTELITELVDRLKVSDAG